MGRYLDLKKIDGARDVDPDLLAIAEIKEAISLAEEGRYSPAELDAYDGYWKAVSSEKTLREESEAKGRAEGRAEGEAKGRADEKILIVKRMKAKGLSISEITEFTNLSLDEIQNIS